MADAPMTLPGWIQRHVELYLTDPEKAHHWDASAAGVKGVIPTLLLVHKGRKSGTEIKLPLIYGPAKGGYAVIASKGGAPTHPSWYLNLVAEPRCEIRLGTKVHQATARVADGIEREAIWKRMANLYPPYTAYQERAGARAIPVVVLEVD